MSTSLQDIIGQLQRSGILSDVQPGMDSGLFGKLSAPYGGPANLGLNLLANSGPSTTPKSFGQIVGQSALQAQQVAQQTQMNALQRQLLGVQIAQGAVGLGTTLQRQQAIQDLLNGGGGGQQAPDTSGAPAQAPAAPGMTPQASGMSANPAASQGLPGGPASALPSLSSRQIQSATQLALLNPSANPLEVFDKQQQMRIAAAQKAIEPQVAMYEDVAKSDNPTRDVRAEPQLQAAWTQYATSHGIDPVKGFNDSTVRTVFGFAANSLRAANGMPTQAPTIPLQNVQGKYGSLLQRDPSTGKLTEVQGKETPTFTLKDVYDPATQTTRAVPVQTGGYGMTGTNPGGAGGQPGPGVNLGVKEPSAENLKNAEMAVYMRSGLKGVQQLEKQGYELSPKARAIIIDAATNEGEGITKQFLSQLAVKNGLSSKDQTYMAALMPMLQAAGHSMAGAKLTLGQVRQNFESLIPVDIKNKESMAKINESRNNYYTGLLSQAGPAVELPQYENTLKADLNRVQQEATTSERRVVNGKTYFKQNGKWYAQ
jgi:hypothetical protein